MISYMINLISAMFVDLLYAANVFTKLRYTKTINSITLIKIISIVLLVQIPLSPSLNLIQNVEAAPPVSEITLADSEGQSITDGITVTVQPGDTGRRVTFEFRGFDDNDGVQELQCSWDGNTYAQSNCSIVSAQTQATFTGPDGVSRLYNLKTGTASRDLAPGPNTYTFGVRMLNSNFQLSPPVTKSFKIVELEPIKTAKVIFESMKVNNDHDGIGIRPMTCCSGEWRFYAFVQGNLIKLKDGTVDGGHSYTLNKEISATINPNLPLSVFTLGDDSDSFLGICKVNEPRIAKDISEIFTLQPTLWERKTLEYQADFIEAGWCDGEDKLGLINDLYPWPSLGAGPHTVTSSTKDFELTYTISVENTGTTTSPLTGSATDTDKDGTPDDTDNCPSISNSDQKDTDRDKKGDKCDSDMDNDGVPNLNDNCRLLSNPNQNDLDDDGRGDKCDLDADGDGKLDRLQNREPLVQREPAQ